MNVNPSLLTIDDNTVAYVSGHNVVMQNIAQRNNFRHIPGIEGCEGITAMAVSSDGVWLAIAEKSKQAICAVYDLSSGKRKKLFGSSDCSSNAFTAVTFANSKEKLT